MTAKKNYVYNVCSSDEVRLITKESFVWKISGGKRNTNSLLPWLLVIFVVCLVFVIYVCFVLLGQKPKSDCIGVLHHHYMSGHIYLSSPKNEKKLSYFGQFGKDQTGELVQRKCIENGFEYSWKNGVTLLLIKQDCNCTSVTWRGLKYKDNYPKDCFNLTGKHWYGGGELYDQVWPLNGTEIGFRPFYPQDMIETHYDNIPTFGPVLGRYWITSNGSAIHVNQSSPLLVSVNSTKDPGQLCLTVDPAMYYNNPLPILNYVICKGGNVKAIHQTMLKKYFKKPLKGPDETMMRYPVWSTWVKYHKEVNQNDVQQFLENIIAHNFSCSQIEIDDMYSTQYGDYDFNPVKFPNPKVLIGNIHKYGCRVTAWAHPFANPFSKAYDEGNVNGYFVLGPGNISGLLYWWNGIAATVDFTNPSAKEWYLNRLRNFQKEYGIDSFKFDAGSVTYLPYRYQLNDTRAMPSSYSVAYATAASEINNIVEVRVGDNSQDLPVFVRFLDRDASWSGTMGLQSVIPTVLTFGILGYPFILPDMIGGNGDPDKELFIRWLQLNAFLPAMQFSHTPWDFDDETIAIARDMMKIRESIFPTLLDGVSNAVKTGEPIIRPLWWVAPDDPNTHTIDQQFMVTDIYLIAPVTKPGVSNISVYLPKGKWMEQFGNKTVHTVNSGTSVIYPVALSDVFYFKNVIAL